MEAEEKRQFAAARVQELKSFYTHLTFYALINVLLFTIDILDKRAMWFYWPLLAFSVAIVTHAVRVYAFRGLLGPRWEEKKMREIMAKIDQAEMGEKNRAEG